MKKTKLSSENSVLLLLLVFFFILGLQYIFFTPPWQAPDEITHFEYVDILARAKMFQIRHQSDYRLQQEIIHSMDRFNAWKYVFRERPSSLPRRFWSLPLYGGSNTKLNRPPLYYILSSLVLKLFRTDNLLIKHYLIRTFSLLLTLFTVVFTYKAARIACNNDVFLSLTAACFVAFLPQFMIISGAINSDCLANLIGTVTIWSLLYALSHPKNYFFLLIFPFLILLGLFTGRTTFFIVPSIAVFSILYLVKSWKRKKFGVFLFSSVSLIVLVTVFLFLRFVFVNLGAKVTTNILEILANISKLFAMSSYAAFSLHSLDMLFKSFWYYSGWNAFSFSPLLYNILKVFTLLGIIGFIKFVMFRLIPKKKSLPFRREHVFLLIVTSLLVLLGFVLRLMSSMDPVARYTFPALSAFAILFVIGLKELIPFELKKPALMILIFGFIVLNIYAIYNNMINSFYYRFW